MALSMALTEAKIRTAKPGDKPYKLTDGRGLYLLVQPSGSKLWHYKYGFDGKEKLMALGPYPDVTLALARERHQEARRLVETGANPMQERKAAKASLEGSFLNVANLWLAHWSEGVTPRHAAYVERRIAADIFPALGAKAIDQITAPEIVTLVKAVEQRGAREIAKRVLETTNQIFRYAIAHSYATRNPAAEIKPRDILKKRQKENYARVDAKELPHYSSFKIKNLRVDHRLLCKFCAAMFPAILETR